jgi:SAM-dependent methyltransferase
MEPGEGDAWNPVVMEFELAYRLSLYYALTKCLRLCELPLQDLRVLDVGSGNGRSTRMYTDLGLRPEQLTGIDVRPGTLVLARKLNPSIRYRVCDGARMEFPDESYNWVQATTVFSSIADNVHRRLLAREMMRQLAPSGYVFYYDLWRSNDFAGNDIIDVRRLFAGLEVIWTSPIRAYQCLPSIRNQRVFARTKASVLGRLKAIAPPFLVSWLCAPTHRVLLARKPSRRIATIGAAGPSIHEADLV